MVYEITGLDGYPFCPELAPVVEPKPQLPTRADRPPEPTPAPAAPSPSSVAYPTPTAS